MYCIQYDEICKKHNFELKHDALGERVTLEYPADSVPKDTMSSMHSRSMTLSMRRCKHAAP